MLKPPNAVQWDYAQGKDLRDPTATELADYYARLVSWYTQGGFTDELGRRNDSTFHFHLPWWEVFNEIDAEHQPTRSNTSPNTTPSSPASTPSIPP